MCGRYTLASPNPARLRERFALGDAVSLDPRFNIAPGQDVVAVTTDREGAARPDLLRWGLVPYWSTGPDSGYKMINARAETLTERPAFAGALERRRCLILADGFFEWQPRVRGPKQPWWITRGDHEPFAFAGLWSTWKRDPDATALRSCAIVTTQANDALREIHDRMPVILPRESEQEWLHGSSIEAALELLRPLDSALVTRVPVSTAVGDVRHDAPDCVEPVEVPPGEPRDPSLF